MNPNARKILFLTVFSTTGDPALSHAVAVARESGSSLLIVEVESPDAATCSVGSINGAVVAHPPVTLNLPADIRSELRRIAPADLVEIARADDIEMIMLGAHGRDGLRKLLTLTPASGVPHVDGQTSNDRLVSPTGSERGALHQLLTPREIEVLVYLAQGLSVKECARVMRRSPSTVDNHKTRLMRKLNIHRVVDLARLAVREGLITS